MRKTRLTGTHNDKDKSGREHNFVFFHSFVSLSVCAPDSDRRNRWMQAGRN